MKVAVIRFPGTNNEHETKRALESFDVEAKIVEHYQYDAIDEFDAFWLAGGFSYGDVLRAGAIAAVSDIVEEIKSRQLPTLGVCNGFQILTESFLLPGVLMPNTSTRFVCKWIHLRVSAQNNFMAEYQNEILKIPIAHFEGNYFNENIGEADKLTFVKYADQKGEITESANPNGSVQNIAGIAGDSLPFYGLMPHPERASFKHQGSTDGRKIIEAFLSEVKQ